jgi:hypothetical protein
MCREQILTAKSCHPAEIFQRSAKIHEFQAHLILYTVRGSFPAQWPTPGIPH